MAANETEQQQPTPPPPPPCTAPANIIYENKPTRPVVNLPLPSNGGYFTGVAAVNTIRVTDAKGQPITSGITLTETVTPEGKPGDGSNVQNPNEVAPYADGTFIDIVGNGQITSKPFDRNNSEDVQTVTNIIGTVVSTPTNSSATQKLDIRVPGCGVVLSATDKQTISNMDPNKPNQMKDYRDSQGRLTNNLSVTVKPASGPIKVVNK